MAMQPTGNVSLTLVETKEQREAFIEFPYTHYQDSPCWVPPLRVEQKKLIDPKKNPFFNNAEMALFTGTVNERPAGRIAAIIDHRYNEVHGGKTGFFGFFETIEHQPLVDLMLKAVKDWLKQRGMTHLLGPANPGMLDVIGVQMDAYEEIPSLMMPYNKPYYGEVLEQAGLSKAMDLYSFLATNPGVDIERMARAKAIVSKRLPSLRLRTVDLRNLKEDAEIIRAIYNQAWAKNWGFIPMTKEEFDDLASSLKLVVAKEVAIIAELEGEPIGFSIPLLDINRILHKMDGNLFPFGWWKLLRGRKNLSHLRTALMGVLPEHQGKGIDAMLHQYVVEKGYENGYISSEIGWVLETNLDMIRVAERMGAKPFKTFRMFETTL